MKNLKTISELEKLHNLTASGIMKILASEAIKSKVINEIRYIDGNQFSKCLLKLESGFLTECRSIKEHAQVK